MVLVVGVALMVVRMGEAMGIRMRVGAVFGAAGIGRVVHAEGVACAGGDVNRRVIALRCRYEVCSADTYGQDNRASGEEDNMGYVRLRQLVIAAGSLDVADTLADVLGLGEAFLDPGVAEFGLVNRVYAIGDQFLEVVVPTALTAPAGRFLARGGDGGYMAIFQTDDLAGARARADALKIRRVWNIDLSDISASHMHPADVGAAIVSIDEARPAASWRWGGPDWERRAAPGKLNGAVIASAAPEQMAARWGEALGIPAKGGAIQLADATLDFRLGTEERMVKFQVSLPDIGAVRVRAARRGLDVVNDEMRIGGVGIVLSG
jgi:hypothetical protein